MTDYARNPAKFTIEWAGGEDKGYWKRYDKEIKDSVRIDSIDFAVLQEAHSISGYSHQFGSCFSNECVEHSEEKHLQIFKDGKPEIVLSGPYQGIKYEATGKYGGKFTAVMYAILLASSDDGMQAGDTVRILAKGSSLGSWIEYKDKKHPVACSGSNFVCKGDKDDPKTVKYRTPIFTKSELTVGEYGPQRNEVIDYLKAKRLEIMIKVGQSDEIPNSSPVDNETVPANVPTGIDDDSLPF